MVGAGAGVGVGVGAWQGHDCKGNNHCFKV